MFLFFSHVALDGSVHSHCLGDAEIEIHMELLTSYANYGYVLLSAFLIDEVGHRTDLPVEVFNGDPIGPHMRELQQEYCFVLDS
ncbi:hypothetical protein GCM10027299_13020 [Larkinella ripae]